jgi:hypothetical protein
VANLERDYSLPRSADDDSSVGAVVIDSWEESFEWEGGIVGTAVVCLVGNAQGLRMVVRSPSCSTQSWDESGKNETIVRRS